MYTCNVVGPVFGVIDLKASNHKEAAQDAVRHFNTDRVEARWNVKVSLDRGDRGVLEFPLLAIETKFVLMYKVV